MSEGTVLLKPKSPPWARFLGFLLIAGFWNGIVSIFVVGLVTEWLRGDHQWGLALFLSIFVTIGLVLIGAAVYQFLAMFNPRPRVTINPGTVRLGETFLVEWDVAGRVSVMRQFRITLEGREEATYVQGTSTSTDKNVFFSQSAVDTASHADMAHGSVKVAVPSTAMHSFASKNNKIVWTLKVAGDIPNWPDLSEEFEMVILPQSAGDGSLS